MHNRTHDKGEEKFMDGMCYTHVNVKLIHAVVVEAERCEVNASHCTNARRL